MTHLEFDLYTQYRCPVACINGMPMMIDTGASIPVFAFSDNVLQAGFKGQLLKEKVSIGGFGGRAWGDLYCIQDFTLDKLNFKHMDVFRPYENQTEYPIILSSSIFYNLKYGFDMIEKKFIVNVPKEQFLERDFKLQQLADGYHASVDGIIIPVNKKSIYDKMYIQILKSVDAQRKAKGVQR